MTKTQQVDINPRDGETSYMFPSFSNDMVGHQIKVLEAKETPTCVPKEMKKIFIQPESAGLPQLKKFGQTKFEGSKLIQTNKLLLPSGTNCEDDSPYFISQNFNSQTSPEEPSRAEGISKHLPGQMFEDVTSSEHMSYKEPEAVQVEMDLSQKSKKYSEIDRSFPVPVTSLVLKESGVVGSPVSELSKI